MILKGESGDSLFFIPGRGLFVCLFAKEHLQTNKQIAIMNIELKIT